MVVKKEVKAKTEKPEVKTEAKNEKDYKLYAVVRVRGGFNIRRDFKDNMKFLHLNQKHHCILLKDSPVNTGMIMKAQDFVTWGEINEATLKELLAKRARLPGDKKPEFKPKETETLAKELISGKKTMKDTGLNIVFRLTPPQHGWERGTMKLRYPRGALGPRKEKINDLLKRMI